MASPLIHDDRTGALALDDLPGIALENRRIALGLIHGARSGHPGSCLSAADLLAFLYGRHLRRSSDPSWPGRDRFVLSKGHACPALYAQLFQCGYLSRPHLGTFRQLGGLLQGEPHHTIPGVDATCGSLGQGFSIAIGLALAFRLQGADTRTVVMLGDGELQEGQVWEAAMSASHYALGNLCAVVDYNKLQSDNRNSEIMGLEPLADRFRAFNWSTIEIDGHCFREMELAFADAGKTTDRPTAIIAHTIKGKGVSFMEDVASWHGSLTLRDDEFYRALADLKVSEKDLRRYHFHE